MVEESSIISKVIPEHICELISKQYYSKIPQGVDFDHIIHDKAFLDGVSKHIAFFGDHGLHHVINVAEQVPVILNSVLGIYIPKRDTHHREFIKNYGILLGFIHDIGMSDVSMFGRTMHGEFGAQEVFTPNFTPIFNALWRENVGNIPWTLLYMHHHGHFTQSPELIFREMLSLCVCHRKTLVPVDILNDPHKLQLQMQYYVSNSLHFQYYTNQIKQAEKALAKAQQQSATNIAQLQQNLFAAQQKLEQAPVAEISPKKLQQRLARFYANFSQEAFAWLLTKNKPAQKFIANVIDTLRIIRCSDALRQRGTELKTSAQFQIFVNQFTAEAIYALTSKDDKMYFIELDDEIGSGESNVASSGFTKEGDLRFEFHRGFFHTKEATEKALKYATSLIAQLDYDIADTFIRDQNNNESFKFLKRPKILLEQTDDNPEFVERLLKNLIAIKPAFAETAEVVPSLKYIPQMEYRRYLNATIVDWSDVKKRVFLEQVAARGHKTSHIDVNFAFKHARIAEVYPKEVIFKAKEFSGLVYIPFAAGLKGYPTGSYSPFMVSAYTPAGNTGVIRGDVRNATIVAKKALKILIIPKDDYLRYWFATYTREEFTRMIKNGEVR